MSSSSSASCGLLLLCVLLALLSPLPSLGLSSRACLGTAATTPSCGTHSSSLLVHQGVQLCCAPNTTSIALTNGGVAMCDAPTACSPAWEGHFEGGGVEEHQHETGSDVTCTCCVGEGCTPRAVGTIASTLECSQLEPAAMCQMRYPVQCPEWNWIGVIQPTCVHAHNIGLSNPDSVRAAYATFYLDKDCTIEVEQKVYPKNSCETKGAADFTELKCTGWSWSLRDYYQDNFGCRGTPSAEAVANGPDSCVAYKRRSDEIINYVRVNCLQPVTAGAMAQGAPTAVITIVLALAAALFARA